MGPMSFCTSPKVKPLTPSLTVCPMVGIVFISLTMKSGSFWLAPPSLKSTAMAILGMQGISWYETSASHCINCISTSKACPSILCSEGVCTRNRSSFRLGCSIVWATVGPLVHTSSQILHACLQCITSTVTLLSRFSFSRASAAPSHTAADLTGNDGPYWLGSAWREGMSMGELLGPVKSSSQSWNSLVSDPHMSGPESAPSYVHGSTFSLGTRL
mmetsp:Transcript_47928/g.119835  ORF Transcript_47928/g.119835 Transcript_47928/m.119835 type:complete len:215 (+) Transcript_47928:466-1110(+)